MKDALKTLGMTPFDLRMALIRGDWEKALAYAKELEDAATQLRENLERKVNESPRSSTRGRCGDKVAK